MASIRRRLRFETVPTSGGGDVFAAMPGKAKVHKIMRDMRARGWGMRIQLVRMIIELPAESTKRRCTLYIFEL